VEEVWRVVVEMGKDPGAPRIRDRGGPHALCSNYCRSRGSTNNTRFPQILKMHRWMGCLMETVLLFTALDKGRANHFNKIT
jgi:hypothetical protein